MGVSQNWGYHSKDYSILGSILGPPYFGKLPYPAGKEGLPVLDPAAQAATRFHAGLSNAAARSRHVALRCPWYTTAVAVLMNTLQTTVSA